MSTSSNASATVVLVHVAFTDASRWNGVIERLLARGIKATAPPNPLRGISVDSAYVASVLEQTPGPVLAVGHSYGGAVITNAATEATNVVGLVYVAAFATEEGEALGDVEAASKDSVLNSALVALHYPTDDAGGTGVELAIDPSKLREAFAADLHAEQTALLAATQRPVAELAFSEPSGPRPGSASRPGPSCHRRQGGQRRRHPRRGAARRREDHRSRGLARDHDLPAPDRDRRDPGSSRRRADSRCPSRSTWHKHLENHRRRGSARSSRSRQGC
jgi:pimeloyl-ACP methyl ester carboxylesterase